MVRALNKLTDAACRAASSAGLLSDGGGLYLSVKVSGSKSWSFVWRDGSRRREMGLGSYPAVRLSRARGLAGEIRTAVAEGRDPIAERKQEEELTFGECSTRFLSMMEGQWRNDKHRAQWRMTLEVYAAKIANRKISEVTTADVLSVLTPIWGAKPETASRLRGRIERVLDFAKAQGWRSGENPALWRGHLKNVLPARQRLSRGHHAAMPYGELPLFMKELRTHEALAARALEFLILTAARSGEVLGAKWEEIDFDAALWIVPAYRMKAGREHRVPLPAKAVRILADLHEVRSSSFVFPGQRIGRRRADEKRGQGRAETNRLVARRSTSARPGDSIIGAVSDCDRPLSSMSMEMLLRRMKKNHCTVHGFRSSFRDWVGDETHFPRDVAEQALAHAVGDATERAYRRADALEKRRQLMQEWERWCEGELKEVVELN
ncbi:integrase arm-type DNA-binding domain-containing protein [Mesorhizobium sp. RP14(2022)]|uniref:Integrase arm-type DNA-binding domain-containing protein n=1 Tax=Mesorhizobium liriopis TaxID=2953882 RepID=A0ABT1C3F8_9HYPH|nr:integrase arm-type DNA-binding domain-containing protein [Mesorhizobium liriopis]MCO6049361.1 integrase arm-type DNA-binding domain-containing protein [Mesorhizobium liriopis]